MNFKSIFNTLERYSMAAAVAEHGEHQFAREILEEKDPARIPTNYRSSSAKVEGSPRATSVHH